MDAKIAAATIGQATSRNGTDDARASQAAVDFEAAYLGPVLAKMLEDAMPDPMGGHGEEMFRGAIAEAMAKEVAEAGGVGIAASVEAQLREYAI